MPFRYHLIVFLLVLASGRLYADETLDRYEAGEFSPCHPSQGWLCGGACVDDCSDSVEDGHFVVRFASGGSDFGYGIIIAPTNAPPPPPIDESFWAEFRFRSNCPAGTNWLLNDAHFKFHYNLIDTTIVMFGDAASSAGGGTPVLGLALDEFHTYRFESVGGTDYTIAVDGRRFIESSGVAVSPSGAFLSMSADGACDGDFEVVNEWDFIRYGTLAGGEQVIAADPPAGEIDSAIFPDFDRFTVTFDSANFVYIDDITVEVTGGIAPTVIQTRRVENTDPNLVEIVLDRPMPTAQTTTFTITDGTATNVIAYSVSPPLPPLPICGDAIVIPGIEECDDGLNNSDTVPDACRTNCMRAHCGDGVVDSGETCDVAGETTVCDADCTPSQCGDGTLNLTAGEACDNGPSNSDTEPDACRTICTQPTCGDNVTDQDEECDGTNDEACPNDCLSDCTCDIPVIPTLSHWGLLLLALAFLALGRRYFGRTLA